MRHSTERYRTKRSYENAETHTKYRLSNRYGHVFISAATEFDAVSKGTMQYKKGRFVFRRLKQTHRLPYYKREASSF